MMKSARPGLCAVAVWSVLCLGAAARAAPKAPAPPEPVCDAMCELGRYIDRDHMVTLAPAAAPEVPASTAPAARPVRPKTAPKVARAKAAPPRLRPSVVARPSPAEPVPPAPVMARRVPEPRRDTTARAPVIPGGAPLVATQFEPQR